MSKSDENPNAYIALLDSPDVIVKKVKRAVTDSGNEVKYAEGKDGINNLLSIYSSLTGEKIEKVEEKFVGKGYGEFKLAVAEVIVEGLRPIQQRYQDYMNNPDYIREVYTSSAEKALAISSRTLSKVYRKIGFVAK